jgi:hypothetical protein
MRLFLLILTINCTGKYLINVHFVTLYPYNFRLEKVYSTRFSKCNKQDVCNVIGKLLISHIIRKKHGY